MIATIGHSNRSAERVQALLGDIELLVDVRSFPTSRWPQFVGGEMRRWLTCDYRHLPALGGRRGKQAVQVNGGWDNRSFGNYADYALTESFRAGLAELIYLSQGTRVAIMCSEAVPWRCHRTIIADHLCARGVPVEHIMDDGWRAHRPGSWGARPVLDADGVTYPSDRPTLW